MTLLGPLTRAAALAGLLLSAAAGFAPAVAAPADVALLKSYIGEWRGRGVLYGGLGASPPGIFTYIQPRTIGLSVSRRF